MQSITHEQERIRAYLLGQIAQADLPDVEQRLLIDAAFYEELSIVEDELIDEYLDGGLSASARQSFESHFMSAPERREKLRFARAFKRRVSVAKAAPAHEDIAAQRPAEFPSEVAERPSKKRPFLSLLPFQSPVVSYALAAAILLMVVGVSWVVWKNSKPMPPGEVMAVTLTPGGLTRGIDEERKRISISPRVGSVQFQLQIPGTNLYSHYRAELHEAGGVKKFEASNLVATQTGTIAVVTLPAAAHLLTPGDYSVKLSGLTAGGQYENVERYYFRVVSN